MKFEAYQQLFPTILDAPAPEPPYDDPHYLDYVKLNWSRQQRWFKVGILNEALVAAVKGITTRQHWIVITEPWCGDAAHSVPFIQMLSILNPLIDVDYQLRDSPPMLIEQYLTRGTRSIPKLIIRDQEGKDLAVWGAKTGRVPGGFNQLKAANAKYEEIKVALQKWYNEDKGVSFQQEWLVLMAGIK